MEALNKIFNKYYIKTTDRMIIYGIIKDIYNHEEFKKRLTDDFLHHGNTTLGEHILEDTIITYLLLKRRRDKRINMEYALKIAMMHDLYTLSWQNNSKNTKFFFNKHGFVHPIEAAINSMVWFPDEFNEEKKARILIDGIVHHMFPFPVRAISTYKDNNLEINNYNFIKYISKRNLIILKKSSNRKKIKQISITKSIYLEGNIMSKADKISTIKQLDCIGDCIALVTGKNKRLIKKY